MKALLCASVALASSIAAQGQAATSINVQFDSGPKRVERTCYDYPTNTLYDCSYTARMTGEMAFNVADLDEFGDTFAGDAWITLLPSSFTFWSPGPALTEWNGAVDFAAIDFAAAPAGLLVKGTGSVNYTELDTPFDFGTQARFTITGSDAAVNAFANFSYVSLGSVPEPMSWAMMVAGFGLVGGELRRRRTVTA
ncbi:PEPxxWA-CTERM sorting domain-containing protein [Sphingomonas sp.]|uniref:PEPxxWA-CTERM sorting domain-containing protein n=1 Tax=Sphingomonas sp. TaxID=28214 RepID=UPI003B3A31AF